MRRETERESEGGERERESALRTLIILILVGLSLVNTLSQMSEQCNSAQNILKRQQMY